MSEGKDAEEPRRRWPVLAPLGLLLLLWLWSFAALGAFKGGPSGKGFGDSYAMFVAAARLSQAHQNPYDQALLYRTEERMLRPQHLPIISRKIVRVGSPPLLWWLMRPFSAMPFQLSAIAWCVGMYAVSGLGFIAVLRALRWRFYTLPLLYFLAFPQVVTGAYYGNVDAVVFAGTGSALLFADASPLAAGALLSLALLKPQVGVPLAALVMLFHSRKPRELIAGFLGAAIVLGLATVGVAGTGTIGEWIRGLVAFSPATAAQPDLAPLVGLYIGWAPAALRVMLELISLGAALALTVTAWQRTRRGRGEPAGVSHLAWLWAVWMLATPFAHFHDEILLAIPVAAVLGQDAVRAAERFPALALYISFFSLLVVQVHPWGVQILPLTLVAIAACLYAASTRGTAWAPA